MVIGVPAAVAAAASFGLAGFLQHGAARKTTRHNPLHPGLLLDLVKFKQFNVSIVLSAAGFGLQVLALRFAPLSVVQPLLVTGVVFYLGCAAVARHHRIDRGLLGGALLALVGLSVFLLVAQPSEGNAEFDGSAALPLGLALVFVVLVCLVVASRLSDELRALPFAVATAVFYGITATLVRSLVATSSWADLFTEWQLYAVIIVAPAGFLLNQNAFQVGPLGAVAVATTTVGDPIVAIVAGVTWLGESLADGPANVVLEVAALMMMTAGVAVLTRRSQQVADRMRKRAEQATSPHEAGSCG